MLGIIAPSRLRPAFENLPAVDVFSLADSHGMSSDFLQRYENWAVWSDRDMSNHGGIQQIESFLSSVSRPLAKLSQTTEDLIEPLHPTAFNRFLPLEEITGHHKASARTRPARWSLDGPPLRLNTILPRWARPLRDQGRIDNLVSALEDRDIDRFNALARFSLPGDGSPALRLAYRQWQEQLWRETVLKRSSALLLSRLPDLSPDLSGAFDLPGVTVFVPTKRPDRLPLIVDAFDLQKYPRKELVIAIHADDDTSAQKAPFEDREDIRFLDLPLSVNVGTCMNEIMDIATGGFAAKMDDDDHYAPHYLLDMVMAWHTSGVDLIAKAPLAIHFEEDAGTWLREIGAANEFSLCTMSDLARGRAAMSGATHAGPVSTFRSLPYDTENRGQVDTATYRKYSTSDITIGITSGLNVVTQRNRRKEHHTWTASDQSLQARAVRLGDGVRTSQIFA